MPRLPCYITSSYFLFTIPPFIFFCYICKNNALNKKVYDIKLKKCGNNASCGNTLGDVCYGASE